MTSRNGLILKGIGGFYYVLLCDDNVVIECKARGKFRNESLKPHCGDNVVIEIEENGTKGTITEIKDRKNSFIRPPVANVDVIVIVVSCMNPKPDYAFVDKMLSVCAVNNVESVICLTKTDLATEEEISEFETIYKNIGVDVIRVCNISPVDSEIEKIKSIIGKKTVAFAGFSGVGKSSLFNNILGIAHMETGEVSKKIGRGCHTTRHVELVEYEKGYLVDTPGFGSLDLPDIEPEKLKDCFVEFSHYEDNCRFSDCMHLGTKWCGVYDAVCDGKISESRYNNYKSFYKILKDKKEW